MAAWKKADVLRAIVVRTAQGIKRMDGSVIRFDRSAAPIANKQNEPIGTRIFGLVPRELRAKNYMKTTLLAPEVLGWRLHQDERPRGRA